MVVAITEAPITRSGSFMASGMQPSVIMQMPMTKADLMESRSTRVYFFLARRAETASPTDGIMQQTSLTASGPATPSTRRPLAKVEAVLLIGPPKSTPQSAPRIAPSRKRDPLCILVSALTIQAIRAAMGLPSTVKNRNPHTSVVRSGRMSTGISPCMVFGTFRFFFKNRMKYPTKNAARMPPIKPALI